MTEKARSVDKITAWETVGFERRSKRDDGYLGAGKAQSAEEIIAWAGRPR